MNRLSLTGYWALALLGFVNFSIETPAVHALEMTYNPPEVGSPNRRVGAGVRAGKDVGKVVPFIGGLMAKTTGITLNPQPILYWTSDLAMQKPLEIVLQHSQPKNISQRLPLLELHFDHVSAGLHAIDLSAHNVSLKPDTLYEWSVTVRMNDLPSGDAFASGYILYQTMTADFARQLKATPDEAQPAFYAEKGIWYDAIARLSQLIAQQPDNQRLKQQRIHLLQQVTLPDEVIHMVR